MLPPQLPLKVIKPGTCTIDPGNVASALYTQVKYSLGIGGGSTVTAVRDDDGILLVDTGYDRELDTSPENEEANRRALFSWLEIGGVHPAEVTRVFITHFHRDHFGNLGCFPHARWLCHRLALEARELPDSLRYRFTGVADGDEVAADTFVLHTPGHTRGHGSLVWSAPGGAVKVALCGDAVINLAWLQSGRVWQFNGDFFDRESARESAAVLAAAADVLIPGHGQPFFSISSATAGRLAGH